VYSEGSISWSEAMLMSTTQRNTTVKVINKFGQLKAGKPANEEL
jgi:N-acetylglucosamine-6-phosphate deacetylase